MSRSFRMYVDGNWVDAARGASYAVPNPATEETFAHAPDASREDMQRAIAAARRAFDQGPWRKTVPADRARILARLADALERRKAELRELLVAAYGAEYMTHPYQIDEPIEHLRVYSELALRFPREELLPLGTRPAGGATQLVNSMAFRQPVGVCGLIPTWNYPLYVTVQKMGPALAMGCTMVVKPSPLGPLCDLVLAEVAEQCDLPPGVFNVVTGQDDALGIELCESPLIDKISFTGSVATGKKVARAAAGTLKRVHLELGGKSALIVLADADLDGGLPGISAPAFFHAGQGCALRTRVLVPQGLHDALVERVTAFIRRFVKVGDPAQREVTLGPLIREERRKNVEQYIASGQEEGASLVLGGRRPSSLKKGYFLEATLFANVRNQMRIAQEEIFGPVLCVLPYQDEAEAIRIANDSHYGLSGGILTRDVGKAIEMAKQIRTGGVSINGVNNALYTPFGGFKESGLGREGGMFGLQEYTEVQSISWPS